MSIACSRTEMRRARLFEPPVVREDVVGNGIPWTGADETRASMLYRQTSMSVRGAKFGKLSCVAVVSMGLWASKDADEGALAQLRKDEELDMMAGLLRGLS